MSKPSAPSITVVRACDEHRVRIYEQGRLWEKAAANFRLEKVVTPKRKPWNDHLGRLLVANENNYFVDDRIDSKQKGHIVLHTHCHLTDTGEIGGSGKQDPKEFLLGNVEYRQLEFDNPRCELCENGDMIPREERFYNSAYKP